jgi:hypothetical protein
MSEREGSDMSTTDKPFGPLRAIVYGGAIVGMFDFAFATVLTLARGRPWYRPWQGVAYALLGPDAMNGGRSVIALGIVCHFVVATSIAAAFVIASRWLPFLTRYAIPVGMVYGAFVFFVMNWVVIPLTRIGRVPPFTTRILLLSLAVHVFLVGLPAALCARESTRRSAVGG